MKKKKWKNRKERERKAEKRERKAFKRGLSGLICICGSRRQVRLFCARRAQRERRREEKTRRETWRGWRLQRAERPGEREEKRFSQFETQKESATNKSEKKSKNLQARAAFSDQQPTRRSEPWSGARFFFRLEWNTTLLLKWGACKALVSTLFPSLLPFRYWEA